jgi:DNA repair exonuclease SbcCD ATPase subunit
MYIIVIILALVIGVVLFAMIKTPKLTPKKIIVETILGTNDALFPHRQEIRNLINDNLGLYNQHDKAALATRYSTVNHRKQAIEQKLASATNNLAAYERVKVQKSFYDLATATIGTLEHVLNNLSELQHESATFEPVIVELQHIYTLTTGANMTTYIADDDTVTARRVAEHIAIITEQIRQTTERIATVSLQTNEFQRIAQSISTALKQAEQDYMDLRGLLSSGQYEAYRSKNQSLPNFFARFDMNSYESIATTTFTHNPEESFINDLRAHLYN